MTVDEFLDARAIRREVAERVGCVFDADRVNYPNGRYRVYDGHTMQEAGVKLKPWYLDGRQPPEGSVIFVCEGETDALAAESANRGFCSVVSVPGASTPPDLFTRQMEVVKPSAIHLAFDADDAGRKASQKWGGALAPFNVLTVPIPEGSDLAATLVSSEEREHTFADLLEASEPFVPPPPQTRVVTQSLASVTHQHIDWLTPRIPRGVLSILVGEQGLGKTTYATLLAADTTQGIATGRPESVIFVSVEDEAATTILPRMVAAGADTNLVQVLGQDESGVRSSLTLPNDVDDLRQLVAHHRPALIVLDPVIALLADDKDANKDQHVRRTLAPLSRLAADYNVAILMVKHLNKGEGTDLIKRMGGSTGWSAAARSVIYFGRDPSSPLGQTRILSHEKCNLSRRASTEVYEIEEIDDMGRMKYVGDTDFTAADSLELGGTVQEVERRLLAVDFLEQELMIEPQNARALQNKSRTLGLSDRDLTFARKKTGATYSRDHASGDWMIGLPTERTG